MTTNSTSMTITQEIDIRISTIKTKQKTDVKTKGEEELPVKKYLLTLKCRCNRIDKMSLPVVANLDPDDVTIFWASTGLTVLAVPGTLRYGVIVHALGVESSGAIIAADQVTT